MTKSDKLVLDFFVVPAFMFLMCGIIVATGFEGGFNSGDNFVAGFNFLIVLAYAYEVGYKKFFKIGRRNYFYNIFVIPAAATMLIFLGGVVLW